MDEIVQFDFPTDSPKIIKVIGVGGGGGNAVNHMYREGIHDVTFVLCNTDNQALAESPVPVKLQLGRSITQGLGAGNRPERARRKYRRYQKPAERRHQDGIHHRRNGRRNRNRSCPGHRPHCEGNGYSDCRYRHHPLYLRRRKENHPGTGRRRTYRPAR